MATFTYTATNSRGRRVTGRYEAASPADVNAFLLRSGMKPIAIKQARFVIDFSAAGKKVKPKEIISFTRMFHVQISAGIPIADCIRTQIEMAESLRLRAALQRILVEIEGGGTLAVAMSAHSGIFSPLFVNMINAGEQSGNLELLLSRLGDMLERNDRVAGKVKGALRYPMFLLGTGVLVSALALVKVVPEFAKVFEGLSAELPMPTKIAMSLSRFLSAYWPYLLAAGALTPWAFGVLRRLPGNDVRIDGLKLRIPVLGDVIMKGAVARFSRTLATMVDAGLDLVEAVKIASGTADNRVIEIAVLQSLPIIESGTAVGDALRRQNVFPPLVINMIKTGDDSGSLDKMLNKLADFYENEVFEAVDNSTKLLEPLLLVLLTAMVGSIVIAVYMPVFGLINALTGGGG